MPSINDQICANNNDSATTKLDVIKELTTNTEKRIKKSEMNTFLDQAISVMSRHEQVTRLATITIGTDVHFNHARIISLIEIEWQKRFNPIIWQDKSNVYVKLIDEDTKILFLTLLQTSTDLSRGFIPLIGKPNLLNQHLTRKPVKLEIKFAKLNINLKDILTTLEGYGIRGIEFTEFKEGKITNNQTRSLSFKTNAAGFDFIYDTLGGTIYLRNAKTRIFPKIQIKPWKCNDCFKMGYNHSCSGKLCPNCGSKEHISKNCNTVFRFCTNCNLKGHRAKDAYCPKNLTAIIRELQRTDVPLKYFQETVLRRHLISNLLLN